MHNIVDKLLNNNIHLYLVDGKLKSKSVRGAMTKELTVLIKKNKNKLIEHLTSNSSITSIRSKRYIQIKPFIRNLTPLTLSFSQQRLWFIDKMNGGSPEYNIPQNFPLKGQFNLEVVETAFNRIIQRHEPLRTIFSEGERGPVQIIQEKFNFKLNQVDLSDLDRTKQQKQIRKLVHEERVKVFDLSADLMLRCTYLKLSKESVEQKGLLLVTLHHIASDGWSMGLLSNEFSAQYKAILQGQPDPLEPLKIQYADYAHWQREWLQGEVLNEQLGYWEELLKDAPSCHQLLLDRPRSNEPRRGGAISCVLTEDKVVAIRKLLRSSNCTLFMLMQATLALHVGRMSNETDVILGAPIAGRNDLLLKPIVGLFLNIQIFRTEFSNNPSFCDLLERTKKSHLASILYNEVPFEAIVEKINPPRNLSHTPIFQIMINLNNTTDNSDVPIKGDQQTSHVETSSKILEELNNKYDISLYIQERGQNGQQCISLRWIYDSHLFDQRTIELFIEEFDFLLNELIKYPQRPVLDNPWKNAQIWTPIIQPEYQLAANSVQGLFEWQALNNASAIALVFEGAEWTYSRLNSEVNQLAHLLSLKYEVKGGARVAVVTTRNAFHVISTLALTKLNACYIPVSEELPILRMETMLDSSEVGLILTDKLFLSKNKWLENYRNAFLKSEAVILDCLDIKLTNYSDKNPPCDNPSDALPASIIFTSGSSGVPKGAISDHRATFNRVAWMLKELPYGPGESTTHMTDSAFIGSIWEMLVPLCGGARLVLCTRQMVRQTDKLYQLLKGLRITRIKSTPSLMSVLLEYEASIDEKSLSRLMHWFLGAEPLKTLDAQEAIQRYPEISFWNMYGSTETMSDSLWSKVTLDCQGKYVPLGYPLDGVNVVVTGAGDQIVPNGVIGELVVYGAAVSQGYVNHSNSPFFKTQCDEKAFRTGDLGWVRGDGQIEYMGRADGQIKIRGYRVDLPEIEYQITCCENVIACKVLARAGVVDDYNLVAYVELDEESKKRTLINKQKLTRQIRALLEHVLPSYMLPSMFMFVDKWPRLPNGKLDEKALPAPDSISFQQEYIAPSNDTERTLVDIWAKLLNLRVDKIGVTANFFELGGHSLLAVRLMAEIRYRLKKEIPIKAIFESSTIQGLSVMINVGSNLLLRKSVTPVKRDGVGMSLSFSQQRLWFIDKMNGGSPEYNMPHSLPLKGQFNLKAVETAFNRIIQRHEPLRTIFSEGERGPVQIIQEEFNFKLSQIDLSELGRTEQQKQIKKLVHEERVKVFDLSADLMLRCTYLKLSKESVEQKGLLLVTLHHIASDGWSMGLLSNEFSAQYKAILQGQPDPLEPLKIQYADYAHWQHEWLQGEVLEGQLNYWDKQLAEVPAVHGLPLDYPRPAMKSHQGASINGSISITLSRQLLQVAQQYQVTPFMLMHGALALLLSRHSNTHDIVVGTPVANRMQRELEPLIGFFVNTLVLRANTFYESFSDYIEHIKAINLDAQANQDVPFESLVDSCKIPRSTQLTPLIQIMLSMVTNGKTVEKGGSQKDKPHTSVNYHDEQMVKFDLTLDVQLTQAGGFLYWGYDTSIFTREHIETLNAHLQRLLIGISESPDSLVKDLPMLSVTEINYLTQKLNDTQMDYPDDKFIHELIEEQTKKTPNRIAVINKEVELSYSTVNEYANYLAYQLIKLGVSQGNTVSIFMAPGVEVLVSYLASMKVGAVFAPININEPNKRLKKLIATLKPKVTLLSHIESFNLLPDDVGLILNVDLTEFRHGFDNPNTAGNIEQPLYIIHTSGSSGEPKGAVNTVKGILNRFHFMTRYFILSSPISVLQTTHHCFDSCVWQYFWPLLSGGYTVLTQLKDVFNIDLLLEYISKEQVTVTDLTPSVFELLVCRLVSNPAAIQQLNSLKYLIIGGEKLNTELATAFMNHCPLVKLINAYGPTETSIGVTFYQVEQNISSSIPIGKPIDNVSIYVLDKSLRLVTFGTIGELHIGGDCIGNGYLNQPELTAEKFIANPFYDRSNLSSSERLYKTGDLVRYLPDENLEFIGRVDDQIKIRGFRIELGEIESQLSSYGRVESSLVIAREDESGQKTLVAYVIATQKEPLNESAFVKKLKEYLQANLSDYMVPSFFVVLDIFPITPNGKIDKKALPAPDGAIYLQEYIAPNTKTEKNLVEIWAEVLKLDAKKISVAANFFELGGHSLLVIKLAGQVEKKLKVKIPLFNFFRYQTIKSFTQHQISESLCRNSTFVTIKSGRNKKTILMVPGMGGSSHIFNELATELGSDHYIIGLDAIEGGGDDNPHSTIEEIAEYNVSELFINNIMPPYVLIGHSFGACVAFEMAKLIKQRTNQTSTLISIDGKPMKKKSHKNTNLELLNDYRSEDRYDNFVRIQSSIEYTPNNAKVKNIVVIQSNENKLRLNNLWQKYSIETVEHYVVKGDHLSLLKTPFISNVGKIIKSTISEQSPSKSL